MNALDLFCGAGGVSVGLQRAGFEVVGVDINPQPNYRGGEFVRADALEYPLEGFDFIWASPPCQRYSTKTKNKNHHPGLIADVRGRMNSTPFVIENVAGARAFMRSPVRLCGSSFGLRVRRHRLFEASFPIEAPGCSHAWQDADKRFRLYDHGKWFRSGVVHVFGTGGGKGKEHWPEAMGIDWMTNAELVEAIPPAYAEFIGRAALSAIKAKINQEREA